MSMKGLKWIICLGVISFSFCNGWGQTGPIVKAARQAKKISFIKSPAAALPKLRRFIKHHGRRPRSTITKPPKRVLSYEQMTPKQREEIVLGRSVYYMLYNPEKYEGTPEFEEMKKLFESYPVPHYGRIREKPLRIQHQELGERVTQYVQTYSKVPRESINKDKIRLKVADMTEKQYEETKLGSQMVSTLARNRKASIQDAKLVELERFVAHVRMETRADAIQKEQRQILQELTQFLQEYGRPPRNVITRQYKYTPSSNLSQNERKEVRLARVAYRIVKTAQADPRYYNEVVQMIEKMLQRPKMDVSDFWENLYQWIADHHDRRPRGTIYHKGIIASKRYLSAAELEEVQLARRLYNTKRKRDISDEEQEKVNAIYNLPVYDPQEIFPSEE